MNQDVNTPAMATNDVTVANPASSSKSIKKLPNVVSDIEEVTIENEESEDEKKPKERIVRKNN